MTQLTTSNMQVAPFNQELHLQQTIDVLVRVRGKDGYPPRTAIDAPRQEFTDWLLESDQVGNWVALKEDNIIGHICVMPIRPYLSEHLRSINFQPESASGFAEIGKLFVDPQLQGSGAGSALLEYARLQAVRHQMTPVLSVLTISPAAVAFYRRQEGAVDLGGFTTALDGAHQVFALKDAP